MSPVRAAAAVAVLVAVSAREAAGQTTFWQESVEPGLAEVLPLVRVIRGALRNPLGPTALEGALELADRARELRPEDPEVRSLRGLVLYRLDRFGEAAEELATAIRLAPDAPGAHEAAFELGVALTRLERFDGAAAAYRVFLLESPWPTARAIALTNLGESLMGAGRLDEAVAEFRVAAATEPRYTHAHLGLAVALDRAGDEAGARDSMLTALSTGAGLEELDSPSVFFVPEWEIHYFRALALEVAGQEGEARDHWRTFLDEGGAGGPWAGRARDHLSRIEGR